MKSGPIALIRYTDENPNEIAAPAWVEVSVDDILEEAASFPSQEEATASLVGGVAEQASRRTSVALPIIDAPADLVAMNRGWLEIVGLDGSRVVVGGRYGAAMRTIVDDAMEAIGYSLVTWNATGPDVQTSGVIFDFLSALLRGDDVDVADLEGDVSVVLIEGTYETGSGAL